MTPSGERHFYKFSAPSVEGMIRQCAETILMLCGDADADFPVSERAPTLYCTGRTTTEGYRLLEWTRVLSYAEPDACAKCFTEPTASLCHTRLRALNTVQKAVTIQIALGQAPAESIPGLPKPYLKAWRTKEQRRIDPKKPYQLPFTEEELHPKVLQYYAKRETPWWRTICINPATQKPEDVCFQLALLFLQEQMIPHAEIEAIQDSMVRYLCQRPWGCSESSTARLVLDGLLRHFVEPQNWCVLQHYVEVCLYGERRQEKRRVFHERREDVEEHSALVAVDDALVQFVREGLPATRSTLYRWAQEGAQHGKPFTLLEGEGNRWLTQEGMDEARQRLKWKFITKHQREALGKKPATARQLTYRYRTHGKMPEDAAQALFPSGKSQTG